MDTKPRQMEDGIEVIPWGTFMERACGFIGDTFTQEPKHFDTPPQEQNP